MTHKNGNVAAPTRKTAPVFASDNAFSRIESLAQKEDSADHVVEMVRLLLVYAAEHPISDIHMEPKRKCSLIRIRIDGILHTALRLPRALHEPVLARLKLLAGLRMDETRKPQDGRIEIDTHRISLRAATMPTLFGEKIALRILAHDGAHHSLESLGFAAPHIRTITHNAQKPFGMIVACGPTGSGKTTTLYSLLHMCKREGLNISTLEDPIEYAVDDINQVPIDAKHGVSFAHGLRSLLRQDPDIIMVGEIRDSETAQLASHAAMTGHLVLTTLHTNDAPSSYMRFLDMGINDFIAASMLNMVIAQRLVRSICTSCAAYRPLDETIREKMRERPDIMRALAHANPEGENMLSTHSFPYGTGCAECFFTGYSGRVGIFEILEHSQEIQRAVLSRAPARRLRESAEKSGYAPMAFDGISKVFRGTTTFDELLRVTEYSRTRPHAQ